jgi:hypothetical protein
MFLGPATIGDHRFQANTVIDRNKRAYNLGHVDGIAYPITNVNPMNASMH